MPSDDDRLRAARLRFGGNLRAVREHRGMGQRELAQRMTERGHSWHQNTVSKTEAGERTVTFDEAEALAVVLGVTTDRFSWLAPETAGVTVVTDAAARLSAAFAGAVDAVAELHAARAQASVAVAGHRDSKYDKVRDVSEGLEASLAARTPEAVLGETKRKLREGAR